MPLGGKYDKLQKSHIRVGGTHEQPVSTYTANFQPHDINAARRVLSEEAKADLRRSHFTTNENPQMSTYQSETRTEYVKRDPKMRDASENLHHKKGSINLGSDQNMYQSTFRGDFQPHPDAKRSFVDPQFQKSHFQPGHDRDYFMTNNRADFQPYSEQQLKDNFQITNETITKLQRSHFTQNEGHGNSYVSEARANYVPRDTTSNIVHDLTRFQASHFNVADKFEGYPMSTTREQLKETGELPRSLIKTEEHMQRERFLRSSHIQVGDEEGKGNYQSETRTQYSGLDQHPPSDMLRPDLVDTKAHVCPADDHRSQYTSETRANYLPMTNTAAAETRATAERIMAVMKHPTDPNCQKLSLEHGDYQSTTRRDYVPTSHPEDGRGKFVDIKHLKSNIQLSGWGGGSYTTANRSMLEETAKFTGQKLTDPIDNKLWSSDVIVGGINDRDNYQSEMRTQYRPKDEVSKITVGEDVKHRLQQTHYTLGTDQGGHYSTEFRSNYINRDDYVEDGQYIGYAPTDLGETTL